LPGGQYNPGANVTAKVTSRFRLDRRRMSTFRPETLQGEAKKPAAKKKAAKKFKGVRQEKT
jgi:hypothetical protein